VIAGIGTDLVEIARIRKTLNGPLAPRFLVRILTEAERMYASSFSQQTVRMQQFVAGRFAAKEAVAKALGCGIGKQLSFQDIQILHDANGKPQCTVASHVLRALGLPDQAIFHISITHTDAYASAFAVVEKGDH
jgi:holo-[acyl-carrier protein] synthase